MVERRARLQRLAVVALLAAFALQAWTAALRDSVTVDELAHVPVGLYFLHHGEFSPDPINPPLARLWMALPVAAASPQFDPPLGADEWRMGLWLMRDEAERYHELYLLARGAVIALALALGLLVHRWAREIYGDEAALVALALYAFSPALLAHAHLATVDLAGAFGFVLVLHRCARHAIVASPANAIFVGAALGLALLLKLSAIAVAPVAAIVLLRGSRAEGDRGGWAPRFGRALLALAITILVVACGYGFQGFARPLSAIPLVVEGPLDRLADLVPALVLPFPEAFVRGFDLVTAAQAKGDRVFYFAGEVSERGWWWYHFAAYALKTPLVFLAGIALAAVRAARGRRAAGEGFLWAGVGLVFLFGGLLNPLKLGVRHVLAAEPLFCILVGGALAAVAFPSGARSRGRMAAAGVVLVVYVASSVAVAPRHLQYFNALAGGPSHGHEWLADSNLDWGQDLVRLREFMDDRGLETVDLAYFGTVHPGVYGIRFEPLTREGTPRWRIASASLVVGLPFPGWKEASRWERFERDELAWLRRLEPAVRIGSLFAYAPED